MSLNPAEAAVLRHSPTSSSTDAQHGSGRRPSTRHATVWQAVRDASGASAVEFALIAPMLLTTILFLMSAGYTFVMAQALDAATQKASRFLRVGTVQTAGTTVTQTSFRTDYLCPRLPSMFNCNNVIVNIQTVSRTDGNYPNEYSAYVNSDQSGLIIPQLDNSKTTYAPGNAQCVVYVQTLYPISVFLSYFSATTMSVTYNGQTSYLLMATSTFLTEPFNSSTTTSC